jgi:dihydropteroate synthase
MPQLVAQAGVPYVVMHWRGHSHQMQDRAVYGDVVGEVCEELRRRVDAVVAEGVDPALIIVDPGLGFAKLAEHNWALLTHLDQIAGLGGGPGFPVLIGASRKRFLGTLLAAPDGSARPFAGSDDATVAITALAAVAGAWCARVHEVPANADAVRVGEAWREAASQAGAMPGSAGAVAGAGAAGGAAGAAGAGAADAAAAGPAGSAAGAGAGGSAGRAGGAGAAGEGG